MNHYDFRGGYATDLSPELMEEGMVLDGTNWYYDERMRKRPGWTNLSTDATINGAGNTVRGFCRAKLNNTWYNIVALDDGSYVNFYYGDAGAYTSIDGTFDWTKAINVEFAVFPLGNGEDAVIAVNGTEKPAIIYYSGGFVVEDLEDYDERTLGLDQWVAGQWDDSKTPAFVDDTTDAQSTTADDFKIATVTNNDGFYVAAAEPFTKVVIKNCPDLGTTVVAEIRYYAGGGTWTALTVTTEPSWVATEADKTLEFDLPLSALGVLLWERYGDLTSQTSPTNVLNKYILRVRFTTADSAGSADYLTVSNTQYLTQIFLDARPQAVCVHQNRLWLFAENAFRLSPPNQVTGWNSFDIERCPLGGEQILQAISGKGELVIFKRAAVYFYRGTTTANFVLRSIVCTGASSKRGAALVGGIPAYVADDGIRGIVNERSVILSRHIQSDMDTWTKTDAVMIEWRGNALVSFPTNTRLLWADPDTIRTDDMGDGRVSLWEWTGMKATQILVASGDSDNGYLIVYDSAGKRFARATTNGYDIAFDTTQTAISTTFQSRYDAQKLPGQRKVQRRMVIDLSKSGDWTLTLLADDGVRTAVKTISSGSGSGHYRHDTEIPYPLDGFTLCVKLVNSTTGDVQIHGFTDEMEKRSF